MVFSIYRFVAAVVVLASLIDTASAQQGCDCPLFPFNSFQGCSGSPTNPYKCGYNKACPYYNTCLVAEANFDLDFDCCQAGRSASCPTNYEPYLCGGNKQCPYDNLCSARAAGYTQNQCTRDYSGRPQVICPSEDCGQCNNVPDDPYNCGPNFQCYYRNLCLVQFAGWNPNSDCRRAGGGVTPINPNNNICPIPSNQDYNFCGNPPSNRIVCSLNGLNCFYDNSCLAQRANLNTPYFNVNSQCSATGGGGNQGQCPVTSNNDLNICRGTQPYPLFCGQNNCQYANTCLAQQANFNPNTQCRPASTSFSAEGDDEEDPANETSGVHCGKVVQFGLLVVGAFVGWVVVMQ